MLRDDRLRVIVCLGPSEIPESKNRSVFLSGLKDLSPNVWFPADLSSCPKGVLLTVEYTASFSAFTCMVQIDAHSSVESL